MRTFWSNVGAGVLSGVVSGVIGGLVLALVAALFADRIAGVALAAHPTCAEPYGLMPLPRSDIQASAGSSEGKDGTGASYGPDSAVDGKGGSLWMPRPVQDADAAKRGEVLFAKDDSSVLRLRFSKAVDVRLVCVVNGLANRFENYENWARVRTVRVWSGDRHANEQTAVLQSLGTDTFPNAQLAARDLGLSADISIRLVDAYTGLTVESSDPDVCLLDGSDVKAKFPIRRKVQARYEQGCLVAPTPRAGLSSVYVYVSSPT